MEFNGDGEARVECACTAGDPARGLEAAEMKKWTRKDEQIPVDGCGSRAGL